MAVEKGAARLHLAAGVSLLHPDEQVFAGMLEGWRHQQIARNLSMTTVESRERVVRRFRGFTGSAPWEWTAGEVDDFFAEARAVGGVARSTLLAYQAALRLFMAYVTDPAYGWPVECEERFGTYPVQICLEWNTASHVQEMGREPTKRELRVEELQTLFDYADERAVNAHASGRKGRLAAFRDATLLKVAYAWGLRRNEVRSLELCDFGTNPKAREFGEYGIVYVRFGKAMAGSPPKRRAVLTVPEMAWAVDCLREWIEEARPTIPGAEGHGFLWPSERSHRLTAESLTNTFGRLREELGLAEGLDFHSLRRSYISHLIEFGYDGLFVQQQVGHEHASTTSVYTFVSADYRTRTVRSALDRIAGQVRREG